MVAISRIGTLLLLGVSLVNSAAAQDADRKDVDVPAKANLYYNYRTYPIDYLDGGIGIEPIVVDVKGYRKISFENTTGTINLWPSDSTIKDYGADGIKGITMLQSSKGMSGISHSKAGFLAGVFVSSYATPETPSESCNFSNNENRTSWGYELEQVFFIGDGLTDKGVPQEFLIPTDADKLYLGFPDGGIGNARGYDDNTGSIHTTVVLHKTLMSSTAKPIEKPVTKPQAKKK